MTRPPWPPQDPVLSPVDDLPVDENHPGLDATRPEEDPVKDHYSGNHCGWGGNSWSPTKSLPKNKEAVTYIVSGTYLACCQVAAAGVVLLTGISARGTFDVV